MRRRALLASASVKQNESSPNNIIIYTSTDQQIVEPYANSFGVNLVSNTYIDGEGQMVFDGDIARIGDWALTLCSSLTSIEIPNSVTSIGEGAFYHCTSLTSIVIPNRVKIIGISAFRFCSSLISIVIPNSVTSIGDYAFHECSSLTSVVIGNSVTSIGDYAFRFCSSLSSVYVKATTPPTLGTEVFDRNASGRKIYVPRASLNAYKTASSWRKYADVIEPYNFDGGGVVK